ncbi:MAG: MoxR family ATPase [Bacteroidota bacterium]
MSTEKSPQDSTYLIDKGLKAATEIALDLGMPLLVTGEPGTGKTRLAYYVAEELVKTNLLIFNTKTTSKAKDLLYQYDALRHFRDSQRPTDGTTSPSALNYISFQALGKAIVDSSKTRYVVLVDEIDKAPRDFPNDVLYEFENLSFRIDEASREEAEQWIYNKGLRLTLDQQGFIHWDQSTQNRPVLILTSNSEKNLPDAFLRRCVYYHIPFPGKETLKQIVNAKVPLSDDFRVNMLDQAIDFFLEIRENKNLRKKPATAELLSWIHLLHTKGIDLAALQADSTREDIYELVFHTYSVIAKNKEDLQKLKEDFG